MALIKCPECTADISDKALACPKCGVQLRKLKRGLFGKIIKLIFVLFNCYMAWSLIYGADLAAHMTAGLTSNAERAGAAIGSGIGTFFMLCVWTFGDIILGALLFFTRPTEKSGSEVIPSAALVVCKSCKKEFSKEIKVCPHCLVKKPFITPDPLNIILISGFFLLLIAIFYPTKPETIPTVIEQGGISIGGSVASTNRQSNNSTVEPTQQRASTDRVDPQNDLPSYDVKKHCKEIASAVGGFSEEMYGTCFDQEQLAYDNIKSIWKLLSEDTKQYCSRVAGVIADGSYEMLETCVKQETSAHEENRRKEFRRSAPENDIIGR